MSGVYSAGSADLISGLSGPGCESSGSASRTNTPAPSCASTGPASPATQTCDASVQGTLFRSISSAADSPARTSALPGMARDSAANDPAYGSISPAFSRKRGRGSRSSKAPRPFAGGCPSCGATSDPSGTPACRFSCPPLKSELRISAVGSSLLPTPTATGYGSNRGGQAGRVGKERHSLDTMARRGLWPTPRSSANENRQTRRTPSQEAGKHGLSLAAEVGGALNPTWVEWLMGFPTEWTALDASETPSCRKSRKRSGGS
jgi:hypothetical protein